MVRVRRVILLTLALFIFTKPTLAKANQKIKVDEDDTPLIITGWLGEENAFIGNLRLTAEEDVDEFIFLASDLILENSDLVIGRQQVSLIGDPRLQAYIPKNFQVMITALVEPGRYTGYIKILLLGQDITETNIIIPLSVNAKARPEITPLPGTDNVQLKLVHHARDGLAGWNSFLAHKLLPDSAQLNSWQLKFNNPQNVPVKVLSTDAVLLGKDTGYMLTGEELNLSKDQPPFPARQISTIQIILPRESMPPDHYTGSIYFTLEGQKEYLTLPVDIYVRTGPLWPIVFLFLGLLVGRIAKWWKEHRGTQVPVTGFREKVRLSVRKLSGFSVNDPGPNATIAAKARALSLVGPTLYVIFLLVIMWIGISSLYVDKGASFGANPVPDYLSLIVWGLSAEVASGSIEKFTG